MTRTDDIERAFSAMTKARTEALIVVHSALTFTNRDRIAGMELQSRLPSMHRPREYVDAGGLISYGASGADLWRRSAAYVAKILKGAKPGDLPVERPTKFDLVINIKTAKALGLTLPPSLLRRADQVIQ